MLRREEPSIAAADTLTGAEESLSLAMDLARSLASIFVLLDVEEAVTEPIDYNNVEPSLSLLLSAVEVESFAKTAEKAP